MSDYTPNTEYVRDFYAKFQANLELTFGYEDERYEAAEAEFDRWLTTVRAEAIRESAQSPRITDIGRNVREFGEPGTPYSNGARHAVAAVREAMHSQATRIESGERP
ncbi:hypothetical protein [Georgenia thermotolerans]|uniref:hypothetical protein n=1 Tax=Georgenia thermotolerans TaxID=527326 RepID=UPI001265A7CA|nr:hypothetical protein [Georgenia thermotolerans]